MTGSVMDDIVLIDKVIGVGEIAISDVRAIDPAPEELAKLVSLAMLGGMVGGKAGVVHFHVGPGKLKLGLLHNLLDAHEIAPGRLSPTHCNRTPGLLADAVRLARRGVYVDIDTTEENLGQWFPRYWEQEAPADRLTVSSDAHALGDTLKLFEQFVASVHDFGLAVDQILPCFTSNTAAALKLAQKGRLAEGHDADVLVLRKGTLEIVHLFARGRHLVKDGRVQAD